MAARRRGDQLVHAEVFTPVDAVGWQATAAVVAATGADVLHHRCRVVDGFGVVGWLLVVVLLVVHDSCRRLTEGRQTGGGKNGVADSGGLV